MAMNVQGFDQLIGDINRMANALNTADEGAPAAKRILRAAAVPIDAQIGAQGAGDLFHHQFQLERRQRRDQGTQQNDYPGQHRGRRKLQYQPQRGLAGYRYMTEVIS